MSMLEALLLAAILLFSIPILLATAAVLLTPIVLIGLVLKRARAAVKEEK